MSSGRCLSAAPLSRPLSLTPPPPTNRLLHHSASHSSQSPHYNHPSWSGRPLSAPFSSSSAPDMFPSSLSPLSPTELLKPRSSASTASSISFRSYALWAGLLAFSLLLSLLFIVHLSAHTAPLPDVSSPLALPAAIGSGLIRVAPNSLHGPASSLQPQLLFSRSVAARQLESFADRKKRKEAIAVEEQVEQDMRRMNKISDQLKAHWDQAQRHSTNPPTTTTTVTPTTSTATITGVKKASAADKAPQTVQLRGGAAEKTSRDSLPAAQF